MAIVNGIKLKIPDQSKVIFENPSIPKIMLVHSFRTLLNNERGGKVGKWC